MFGLVDLVSGSADSVALAKSLINMSLDLHKASLERSKSSDDEEGSDSGGTPVRSRVSRVSRDDRQTREHVPRYYSDSPLAGGGGGDGLTGLANLLTKPDVLAAVNILGQLSSMGGGSSGAMVNQVREYLGKTKYQVLEIPKSSA